MNRREKSLSAACQKRTNHATFLLSCYSLNDGQRWIEEAPPDEVVKLMHDRQSARAFAAPSSMLQISGGKAAENKRGAWN
jgi:hypothetical protein